MCDKESGQKQWKQFVEWFKTKKTQMKTEVIQLRCVYLSRVQLWGHHGLQTTRLFCAWIYPGRILEWVQFSTVQSLSHVWLFATPWTAACQASLSITNHQSPPKPMSMELVMPSNHLILSCPLLLLPSIFPSIRGISNESALRIRWPKYWSFSFNIIYSNEHSGLISFRMDCLDLLAVQGTLKSLLQHHSSKASILWRSAFFIVQLSHPYMTTEKTIALTVSYSLLKK